MKNILILCVLSLSLVQCQPSFKEASQLELGVSESLATLRASQLKDVHYDLVFVISDDLQQSITGSVVIGFKVKEEEVDVILDFDGKSISNPRLNDHPIESDLVNGHLILPSTEIKKGYNEVVLDFVSGDKGVNRSESYLYTLFVPNRASNVFPCFDQPKIKAKYRLTLQMPKNWDAISTTDIIDQKIDEQSTVTFDQTAKMSSYLMSFAAGEFERVIDSSGEIELLHRESDVVLVEANLDQIFKEHQQAIKWLEDYTKIKMPFSKFGMVLIPGFPFGGMEHVGAIQYRARSLMLSPDASLSERMNRSKLIAHETAHMWFGNLVTMQWFDDVWVKEVFANFIANKMIRELYPAVDHDLEFLYEHYPAAYAIDRTEGTHAIHQQLDNLNDAAHMYGSIIYHKAPVMMYHLEQYIGEKAFQEGVKEYLENYAYENASWNDLVLILQRISGKDISMFSDAWVNQAGMPYVEMNFIQDESVSEYDIVQLDKSGLGRVWPQYTSVTFSDELGDDVTKEIFMDRHHYMIEKSRVGKSHKFLLMNSNGKGYGVFSHGLDYERDEFIFNQARVDLNNYKTDLARGAAYVNLHEYVLQEGFHPQLYIMFLGNYLKTEQNELIIEFLLSKIQDVFYHFLNEKMRGENAMIIEQQLLDKIESSENSSVKKMLFDAYVGLVKTPEGIDNLRSYWNNGELPEGILLSSYQKEQLAINIAFKANDSSIIEEQIARMENKDRIERLRFIKPALSIDEVKLTEFFESLKLPENRVKEPWVLTAMYYLHHPYRNESIIIHLPLSIDMIEELSETGDIFFVKRWLDNSLNGYQSQEALNIILTYFDDNPDLNPFLKRKVQQSMDRLIRSEKNLRYYYGE
ncbi:MAG: M1 family aminopeptidase [Reichenbachiella sp.]